MTSEERAQALYRHINMDMSDHGGRHGGTKLAAKLAAKLLPIIVQALDAHAAEAVETRCDLKAFQDAIDDAVQRELERAKADARCAALEEAADLVESYRDPFRLFHMLAERIRALIPAKAVGS